MDVVIELDPKKLGMLTGNVGNFINGLAMSEDFSTPLKRTAGLYDALGSGSSFVFDSLLVGDVAVIWPVVGTGTDSVIPPFLGGLKIFEEDRGSLARDVDTFDDVIDVLI